VNFDPQQKKLTGRRCPDKAWLPRGEPGFLLDFT